MYESYEILKIKEKAGISSAVQELKYRKRNRKQLPFPGINDVVITMVTTKEMEQKMESISNLYQKVSKNNKRMEIIILDAFHSATIEGARTTVEKVKEVHDNPKTKDDKMVINTIKGMQYAYDNRITKDNIRTLWNIVVQDVCDNQKQDGKVFRSGMVYVGSGTDIIHEPARPETIEDMMLHFFEYEKDTEYNIWLRACILHFYFVYIHPFCDGNGRTARILTQSYLYHYGMDKIQYLPLSRTINLNLKGYYSKLKEAEVVHMNGGKWIDITSFLDYMLDMFEQSMILSMKEEYLLSDSQKRILTKMQKRGKGTEITISQAADILGLTEQTSRKILNSLFETGHLAKDKRGHKNIYILK